MLNDVINNIPRYVSVIAIIAAIIGSAKYIFYLFNKDDLNVIFATASQNDFDRFIGTILVAMIVNSLWNFAMHFTIKNDILSTTYALIMILSFIFLLISLSLIKWIHKKFLTLIIFISGNLFLLSYTGLGYNLSKPSVLGIYMTSSVYSFFITYGFLQSSDFYRKSKNKIYKTIFIRNQCDVDNLLNSLHFVGVIDTDHYSYKEANDVINDIYTGPYYIYYIKDQFMVKIEKK